MARAIPLVIKDFILWSADAISESYMAGSISNIGKIDLPEAAKPFVKRFDVFVSTEKLQACICSYGSELTGQLYLGRFLQHQGAEELFPSADSGRYPRVEDSIQ